MKCPFYLLSWVVYVLAQSTGSGQENVHCLAKETWQNKKEKRGGDRPCKPHGVGGWKPDALSDTAPQH